MLHAEHLICSVVFKSVIACVRRGVRVESGRGLNPTVAIPYASGWDSCSRAPIPPKGPVQDSVAPFCLVSKPLWAI